MGVKENEAALMRAVDAWNSGDVNSYLELYAEGIKLHAGNYDFPNQGAVAAMYQGMLAATSEIHLNMLRPLDRTRSSVRDMCLTPATPGS